MGSAPFYLAQCEMLGEEGVAHMSVDAETRLYGYSPIALRIHTEINLERIGLRLS
jgi:hypothetical protein